jgi:hypothetical protein
LANDRGRGDGAAKGGRVQGRTLGKGAHAHAQTNHDSHNQYYGTFFIVSIEQGGGLFIAHGA